MLLPPFEYKDPATLAKAISGQKASGKFLAGGTDLLVAMKEHIQRPEMVVDLNRISRLRGIKRDRKTGDLRVGALTTLTQFQESPLIQEHLPLLGRAVGLVSTLQLRNMGTLGGNLCLDTRCNYYNQPSFLKARWEPCLKIGGKICHVVKGKKTCHAVYSGDMAVSLIALGARAEVAGGRNTRELDLLDFFTGSGIRPNILEFNQILTEVRIPPLPENAGFSYQKLRLRDTVDFPLLGVAVFIQMEGRDGKCRDVRLVMGAVGPGPLVVEEAAGLMRGKKITPKLVDGVARAARGMARPVDNTASSPGYRRQMVPLFVKKAFDAALESIKNKS